MSQIITRTGGIDLFPQARPIDPSPYTSSLDAAGVPYEWIDGTEVRRRWPAFAAARSRRRVRARRSTRPDTGIVPAGRGTAMLQRLARQRGADLRPNTPVRSIRPVGGEVDVVTDTGTVRCGTWSSPPTPGPTPSLAPLGHALPLVVLREQVSYFPTADLAPSPGRFPVWIWMDDPCFYGFPVYGDTTAVKAAEDCGGPEVDADMRTFDPDPDMEARLASSCAACSATGFANRARRPASTR